MDIKAAIGWLENFKEDALRLGPGAINMVETFLALGRAAEPKDPATEREHCERAAKGFLGGETARIYVTELGPYTERERAAARAEGAATCQDTRERLKSVTRANEQLLERITRLEAERDQMAFARDTHMEAAQSTAATFHTRGVQSLNKQLRETESISIAAQERAYQAKKALAAAQAEISSMQLVENDLRVNWGRDSTALHQTQTKLTNLRTAAERYRDQTDFAAHDNCWTASQNDAWITFARAIEAAK